MPKPNTEIKISAGMAEDIRNEIKSLLAECGHNLKSLAEAYKSKYGRTMTVQNLGNKINKGTIRYFEYLEILDILGYKHTRPTK